MTTATTLDKSEVNAIRTALGIGGVLAVIAGILILAWPGITAGVVTVILAVYAIAAGLAYMGFGIFSKTKGGWARIGHIVLGILFLIAGVVALFNIAVTTAWLAVFVAVMIGISWIVEGIVSVSTLSMATSKGWTIFFAIVSIIAGIYLLVTPFLSALALWWLLGIVLIAVGVFNVVRAFTYGK